MFRNALNRGGKKIIEKFLFAENIDHCCSKQRINARHLSDLNTPTASTKYQYRCIKTKCASDDIDQKPNTEPTRNSNDQTTNIELKDLEISSNHGEKLVVNLTWLRDSCRCPQCTHQYSRQRLYTPKDFRQHHFAVYSVETIRASSSNGDCLKINWVDGHVSTYSIDWLRNAMELYPEPQLDNLELNRSRFLLPQDDFYLAEANNVTKASYWSVEDIDRNLEAVNYNDLTSGFDFSLFDDPTFINGNKITDMSPNRRQAMHSLAKQLVTNGLAKIINVPQEPGQVLKVARSLAYERPTGYGTVFDVVVEPSDEINLAYSAQEFDLHSDLTYREISPGVQLLHCITNSTIGGLSYFTDAFKAAQELRESDPKLFNVLVKFPCTFIVRDPYRDVKFRRQAAVLSLDFRGDLDQVYYSPFMLPPIGHMEDVKLFYTAMDKLTQLLQSERNKLVLKMNPGDLFIFHNRRVLHGRSSYDPSSSKRFLQGCYMDWDEIVCLNEKLQSSYLEK